MPQPTATVKKYSQITISLGSFFVPFMLSALNLALPAIGQEFHTSVYLLSWVTSGYILAAAAFLVPFGRFADINGRRKIYLYGISLFSFSALLCSLAWSMKALIAFRILQGIGAAMIFSTGMAILASVFPPEERGRVLGINGACVYTGQSLAPVLGGGLTQYFGWRFIFFLMFLAGLLIIYIIKAKLKTEWIGAPQEKFDTPGALLYTIGIIILMYGFSSLSHWTGGKYFLIMGILVMFLFVKQELNTPNPILQVSLFTQNITFTFSNLAAFINYSTTFAIAFLLSLYLQVGRSYDAKTAGFILLAQPVIMAIFTPQTGKLSDRFQPRILASLGMGITALALFLFSFLTYDTPIWLLMCYQVIVGLGFAFLQHLIITQSWVQFP